MERTLLLLTLLLLGLCALTKAQSSGSGSGSGNGTVEEMRNCSDLRCSHGCNETDDGPMCYCPSGYSLSEDLVTCQPCRGGLFGVNCASMCNCSDTGNTCDRTNGVCICNPCYGGPQCEQERSLDCYVQFLEIPDKSLDNLRNFYGGDGYPRPQAGQTTLPQSLAAQIMDTDPALVSDVEFEPVSRGDVGQGDLVKLSWRVYRNRDPAGTEEALMNLSNKVKLGNIRATYIAQDSTDNSHVLVTLNSGVKEDPN